MSPCSARGSPLRCCPPSHFPVPWWGSSPPISLRPPWLGQLPVSLQAAGTRGCEAPCLGRWGWGRDSTYRAAATARSPVSSLQHKHNLFRQKPGGGQPPGKPDATARLGGGAALHLQGFLGGRLRTPAGPWCPVRGAGAAASPQGPPGAPPQTPPPRAPHAAAAAPPRAPPTVAPRGQRAAASPGPRSVTPDPAPDTPPKCP